MMTNQIQQEIRYLRKKGRSSNDAGFARRPWWASWSKTAMYLAIFILMTLTMWHNFVVPSMMSEVDLIGEHPGRLRAQRRQRNGFNRKSRNQNLLNLPANKVDAILQGDLTLVKLHVPPGAVDADTRHDRDTSANPGNVDMSKRYRGVQGVFCYIDWSLQAHDPSEVPMFRDLMTQSELCDETMTTVDLWDMTRKASAHDASHANGAAATAGKEEDDSHATISLKQPTGVVFHQSRCGSTLTSNLMVTSQKSPDIPDYSESRVWSESRPPIDALRACVDAHRCDDGKHAQLIQDVFYMMGRKKVAASNAMSSNHRYYVKFQSISTQHIAAFTKAMPDVPWVFVYRDSIEVMQSYWRGVKSARAQVKCASHQAMGRQSKWTLQVVKSAQRASPSDLTKQEYCAAHLAGLAESALTEYERAASKGKGRFVNYNQLPDIMWDSVLPNHFHVPKDEINISAMQRMSQSYSKARGRTAVTAWKGDSERKRETATQEVRLAVQTFMAPRLARMNELSGNE
mmetsp:Transcript_1417/g.3943  ORF Transcript_1417/g.3943 Transcript_1417/m.3943 type:complete len:514 (-) Transcript_1417:162-1703(-)